MPTMHLSALAQLGLTGLLVALLLCGCGQGVRVQPKGQVQTSIGVGR